MISLSRWYSLANHVTMHEQSFCDATRVDDERNNGRTTVEMSNPLPGLLGSVYRELSLCCENPNIDRSVSTRQAALRDYFFLYHTLI